MGSNSLKPPIPCSQEPCGPAPEDPQGSGDRRLTPLSHQAQADLWRYIEHLEKWRQSVGYEIHDGLTQQITAALLFLESFNWEKPDRTALERCRAILEEALAESRRLIQGLNPKRLDEEGLAAALEEFLLVPSPSNAQVRLDIDNQLPPLPTWQRTTLFRFLQEAINNARKHSEATQIEVSVHAAERSIVATIHDNGIGFDPQSASLVSHGLRSLQHKAELLEAKLDIDSAPQQGTKLTLHFQVAVS
ncbi:sensor histidine kinase [Bremerella cremea]|nr:sensor histidine kinase [Bremerella cremea]